MTKWQDTEKIVAFLEARLTPSSEVKHNVRMKDLTGDSEYRQCDVVIISGKYPRTTITIVEVQDRKSKVNINTFDGFVEKMKSVGAQHLIVVSKQDFPVSVRNKAKRLGPSVRLVKLNENYDNFPISFVGNNFMFTSIDICSATFNVGFPSSLKGVVDPTTLDQNKYIFLYGENEFSDQELFRELLRINRIELTKGKNDVSFEMGLEDKLKIKYEEEIYDHIILSINAVVEYVCEFLEVKPMEYIQEDSEESLIWYSEGVGEYKGEKLCIGLSFIYDESSGGYRMNVEKVEGQVTKYQISIYEKAGPLFQLYEIRQGLTE